MLGSARRQRSQINAWPGYVDALSALLMLVIFMLMIYMVTQLYLSQALSDRDSELASLSSRLNEISRLLMLEEQRSEQLAAELTSLQSAYQQSLSREEAMQQALDSLLGDLSESEQAQQQIASRAAELEAQLEQERTAFMQLRTLADDQEARIAGLTASASERETALKEEQELTAAQQDFILQLTQRIDALQQQLQQISAALQLQEALVAERDVEIAGLGQRLNRALAERVNQLERYQSEFFGRLRDLLEANENIRIVGDRFLLPSELFFASGSAELGPEGRAELDKLAALLLEISATIPDDLDWILRVDGHTDRVPINTPAFPSNWELSTARAVSVVRYLASRGVPQQHMAAAGFGEFYPVDSGTSAAALQRNRRIEIKLTDR
ncbi:Flagellar motor rotation protein MotB [Nitrincola lacisaponensis]|uniref:Flagellar motor rotation protein MotB n=1 Tax=Nitrincola lacisaponensis TaxID=267850 RepID=A0A063Y2Q2_9GAMM|nr:peptidoglycan -binding protein [Nitrincola lacisaponensis]KDE39031.1 Flagellar motor rotation protein MotB [Nitrincola lacisaponensis]